MFRAAATAASVSRSSWSATRTQIVRCGTGGEQRHWTRGHAAKEATIARAAVKEDCTFGVEARVRARAAVTEDCTFGVGGRAAMQRCISDLPDHVKTPKEVAFGVGARANYLADAVKNSNKSSFGLDARALSDRVDTVDLQGRAGIGDDPAKEVGVGLICTNKPAPHKVGIFALGKAGMPLSCATWNLKGGHSNVYSRPYSSFGGEQTQAQKDAEKEKEERRRREEERGKRKEEEEEEKKGKQDDENWTFLLFVKKHLKILKAWRVSSQSKWTKLEPHERYYYQLLVAVGCFELGGGAMMLYSHKKSDRKVNEKFKEHVGAIEDMQNQQEKGFSDAEGLAADERAKEAFQRSAEAMQRRKFVEEELAQMGRQMYEFQLEIAEIKKMTSNLAKLFKDRK